MARHFGRFSRDLRGVLGASTAGARNPAGQRASSGGKRRRRGGPVRSPSNGSAAPTVSSSASRLPMRCARSGSTASRTSASLPARSRSRGRRRAARHRRRRIEPHRRQPRARRKPASSATRIAECIRKVKEKVPCWNAVARLDSTLRLIAVDGEPASRHSTEPTSRCPSAIVGGEDRPGRPKPWCASWSTRWRRACVRDLAPVAARSSEFRVMETREGLSGDAGRAFRDAVAPDQDRMRRLLAKPGRGARGRLSGSYRGAVQSRAVRRKPWRARGCGCVLPARARSPRGRGRRLCARTACCGSRSVAARIAQLGRRAGQSLIPSCRRPWRHGTRRPAAFIRATAKSTPSFERAIS